MTPTALSDYEGIKSCKTDHAAATPSWGVVLTCGCRLTVRKSAYPPGGPHRIKCKNPACLRRKGLS